MDNYCLTETNTGQQIFDSVGGALYFDNGQTQLIYVEPCQTVLTPETVWLFQFISLFFVFFIIVGFFLWLGKKLM